MIRSTQIAYLFAALSVANWTFAADAVDALKTARTLLAAGKPDEALLALPVEEVRLPDYRALLEAEINLARGEWEEARRIASRVPTTVSDGRACAPKCRSPLADRAITASAMALSKTKPEAAARLLATLAPEGARLEQARQWAAGTPFAQVLEQRLLVEAPESVEGRALADRLGLSGVRERIGERWPERIERLLESHQNESAAAEAAKLHATLAPKDADRCRMGYIEGKARRKLRQYRAALTRLSLAREECWELGQSAYALRAALLEVQVLGIRRDLPALRTQIAQMAERAKDHAFLDDALFVLAETAEALGHRDEAEKTYRAVLNDHPRGDMWPDAAWRLARGDLAPAKDQAALLERIATDGTVPPIDRARAAYWLARRAEGTPVVCDRYRALVESPPLSFYTWLALSRTRAKLPECAKAIEARLLSLDKNGPGAAPSPAIQESKPAARALRLADLGEVELAEAELTLLEGEGLSDDELRTLALLFDTIGAHPHAQKLLRTQAGDALAQLPSGPVAALWRAAYSRPFSAEIEAAAAGEKLEPWLLYALVREESTFDPEIVSWAGATGLSQLMPATALQTHADLRLGRLDLNRLTEPALNLRLGARVLADGLQGFKEVPLALAAYNGGPGLAKRLLPAEGVEFDRFVESISVKETRNYVRRVMESWAIYRFLYDAAEPFAPFPAHIGGVRSSN